MKCPLCKGKMKKGKTTLPFEMGKEGMIVIKDVPALVCGQCGDAFVEMEVAKQVEQLIQTAKKDGMTLGFVSYKAAA